MKVPPLTNEMFYRGRTLQPMRSAAWQATKDDGDKFRYGGDFVANKAIMGSWTQVGKVASIADFVPGVEIEADKTWPLQQLNLKDNGRTGDEDFAWSEDMLMDLTEFQALKMTLETIDGIDYLFI